MSIHQLRSNMYEMLTLNLIFVYYFVFTSILISQSSTLYYQKYYVSEKCTSVEKPEPIKLTDASGGSAVYFALPNIDKPLIRLTQTCVIVVQSPPGQGLVLHPVTLDLTRFLGRILIYQLHLSVRDSHTIYDLDDSFNSNDDHLIESVALNILPGDNETIVLFSFQPNSNQTNWNQLSFEFLITSFIYTVDV